MEKHDVRSLLKCQLHGEIANAHVAEVAEMCVIQALMMIKQCNLEYLLMLAPATCT